MFLVLGSQGQVGQRLTQVLGPAAITLPRASLDIRDTATLTEFLHTTPVSAVINAAALTNVAACEADPALCLEINTHAVLRLAEFCQSQGIALVNYSSDYVFDGTSEDSYDEHSPTHPINHYGASKALLEKSLESFSCALTIRTSWVFDSRGENFFSKLKLQAKQGKVLRVVNDQRGSPTWAKDLALVTRHLLQQEARGLYNYSATGSCTWFEMARFLGYDVQAIATEDSGVQRPRYSVLSKAKITPRLPPRLLKDWRQALGDCYLAPPRPEAPQTRP